MLDLQRVKKVVRWLIFAEYGENEKEISELMGYNTSSFSQIMNGRVPISDNFINNLCVIDENINKDWVKTGKGEMFKMNATTMLQQANNNIGSTITQNQGKGSELTELEALRKENSLLKDKIIKLMEEKMGL